MMSRESPIYAALVSQTQDKINDLKRDIDLIKKGKMRVIMNYNDTTGEWTKRLEGWLADSERLLEDLRSGKI